MNFQVFSHHFSVYFFYPQARSEARKIRKETGDPGQTPKTIENQRKKSETILEPETAEQDRIEEVERDIATDEFSSYFNKEYEPKILLTSCTKDIKKVRSP